LSICAMLLAGPAFAMNKAELIDAIASKSGLSKADSKRALEGFIDATAEVLRKGDNVSLMGFGSFSTSRSIGSDSCETMQVPHFEYDPATGVCVDGECRSCATDDEEIARHMSALTSIDPKTSLVVIETIKSEIIAELFESNRDVKIRGLGQFAAYIEAKASRRGRNPQTGKEIKIAAKRVVKFKAGAALSNKVN
jgi:DNA-binding protein HU-beta